MIPGNVKQLDKIRVMRAALQVDIDNVVNEFGPQLFEDFQRTRIVTPAAVPAPVSPTLTRRRSTYGAGGQGTFLTHPLSSSPPSLAHHSVTDDFCDRLVGRHDLRLGFVASYRCVEW